MLWFKAFHLIFMVTWFAGLFYLPRLFVYHAQTTDQTSLDRFKIMEKKLLILSHIGFGLTLIFGLALLHTTPHWLSQGWLHTKLLLIALLFGYHLWCGILVKQFAKGQNKHSQRWYRFFNEIPAIFLIAIILLATFKPF